MLVSKGRLYLVVVQRGVVAQGADGSQLNKAVVFAAVSLGTTLGTGRQRNKLEMLHVHFNVQHN